MVALPPLLRPCGISLFTGFLEQKQRGMPHLPFGAAAGRWCHPLMPTEPPQLPASSHICGPLPTSRSTCTVRLLSFLFSLSGNGHVTLGDSSLVVCQGALSLLSAHGWAAHAIGSPWPRIFFLWHPGACAPFGRPNLRAGPQRGPSGRADGGDVQLVAESLHQRLLAHARHGHALAAHHARQGDSPVDRAVAP